MAARLGFDFETVKALAPGIIYVSVSGFGQTGPLSAKPAMDPVLQAFTGFTLENYNRFLGDSYYQGVLFTTFRIALITTVCSLLLAYPLAYFLARYPTRWRGVLLFLVIAPLMSGVIVRTYAWIVILGEYGAINRGGQWIGLIEQPLKLLNTEFAVIIALVHILLPFMVFPLFSAIAGQDPDLTRAAGTLGARPWRTFYEVTLPLSRQGILMGSVLVFSLSAGAVVTPSLMGGKDVQTIGMNIYELVTSTLNWPRRYWRAPACWKAGEQC